MVRSSNCSASFTKSSTAWRTFFSTSSFTSFPIICSVTLMFSYTEIFAFSFARRSPNISSSDSLNSISAPIITASAVMSIDACCKICCPPAVECVVTAAKEINVVHNRYVLMKAFSSSPASTYLRNISAQAWLSLSAL